MNGKHLNASMFLQLALEYTETLSSKESPVILTALDRVVHAETVKIIDTNFDLLKIQFDEKLNEDTLPLSQKDFDKIVNRLVKAARYRIEKELASILSFKEIVSEMDKFKLRAKDLVQHKYQQNYSASYHFSKGLIQNLLEVFSTYKSLEIHDYLRKWSQMIKEYKERGT